MSELLKIVSVIKEKKKAQLQWASMPVKERLLVLESLVKSETASSAWLLLSAEMGFGPDEHQKYFQQWLIRFLEDRKQRTENFDPRFFYLPVGFVAIGSDSVLHSRYLFQFCFDALLAGNAIFVSSTSQLFQKIFEFSDSLENLISLVPSNDETFEFLIQHPSVKSVAGVFEQSRQLHYEKLAMGRKQYSFITHGKNAAVILPEFDDECIKSQLLPSLILGGGQLVESVSRIYCVESALPRFLDLIMTLWPAKMDFDFSLRTENLKQVIQQIKMESGKPLFGEISNDGKMSAVLIKDLPNCSELMQIPLLAPIVTLTEIKYAFDSAKWVNNSDFAVCASLYGPAEKLQKLANKFEVGGVGLNNWTFESATSLCANKSSRVGLDNEGPYSGLYNFVGKLTL